MINTHQKLIRAVVFKLAGATTPHADLEDVIQNVNLRLLEGGLTQFDPARGSIEAFITVMARSMTIDGWRRTQRRPTPAGDEIDTHVGHGECTAFHASNPQASDLTDHADDALTMLLREEQRNHVEEIIKRLPPDDQHFLLVSIRPEFDNRAYAKRLGVTEVALRVRKHRLSERLRSMINELKS